MERRIQLAEEKVVNSSSKRNSETDELRRELEEARVAERTAKLQLQEAKGPLSPPPFISTTANTSNLSITPGITVRNNTKNCSTKLIPFI